LYSNNKHEFFSLIIFCRFYNNIRNLNLIKHISLLKEPNYM